MDGKDTRAETETGIRCLTSRRALNLMIGGGLRGVKEALTHEKRAEYTCALAGSTKGADDAEVFGRSHAHAGVRAGRCLGWMRIREHAQGAHGVPGREWAVLVAGLSGRQREIRGSHSPRGKRCRSSGRVFLR